MPLSLEPSTSLAPCPPFQPARARAGRPARRRLVPAAATTGSEGAPPPASGTTSSSGGGGGGVAAAAARRAPDPFRQAGARLESLLNGVGDGEEELLTSMLMAESPERKLALSMVAGGAISCGACLVCWLCGIDPLGGARLSGASAHAALVGGAAAAPLVALKAALWSDAARAQLPFLEELQRTQVDVFRPLLYRLTPAQTLVVLGSEVVPGVLILLPAATGGIAKSLQIYCGVAGVAPPEFLPPLAALLITALMAGFSKVAENAVSMEEYEIVTSALDNSDRYYRLMGMGRDNTPQDAARQASAFRAVALTWLARNQVATRFAAVLAALEVLYLGGLWQQTGDLSAPLVAALGAAAVDFAHIRSQVPADPDGTAS